MNYLYVYLVLFLYFFIWFLISQIKRNNSLVDIAWGASIIVTAVSSLLISKNFNFITITTLLLVVLWGLRLSVYLFIRNWNKPEDFRYMAMRKKWQSNLTIKAFLKVFLTQSLFSYLISIPIIMINFYSDNFKNTIQIIIFIIGISLFIIGYLFEVIGDKQLKNFKKKSINKGKIIKSGLWKYTRHPNYFGEVTLWWGFGIIAIAIFKPITLIGLISPIIITILLLYVTGVPLLEKRYENNLEYQEYKKTTSKFFPLPQKNSNH
ncbi:MAG TPA: DUF1295 domain-containing protein [Acholeplasmataceae bacterium]|nr:DUF1295 domain-containing protein [Acholeplasmataceae bacterium]